MKHDLEFTDTSKREEAERKRQENARVVACAYARLFKSEDGATVLKDLRAKFGHERPRFDLQDLRNSLPQAAVIDGQCAVLREIETAIRAGGGVC
jgi:hypothetical protein